MRQSALQALEFDRIVHAVQSLAQTPMGAARLAELRPELDPGRVTAALAATAETVRFLAAHALPALQATDDFESIFAGAVLEGIALEPPQLLALADFLASAEAARQAIVSQAPGAFPSLEALATRTAAFPDEVRAVRRAIDPTGAVSDDASPELRSLRNRTRTLRTRLRGTLESFLRRPETARYLQQQIVTDRNGRYVLIVRAEHRGAIPGVVHGRSTSGASLFLEPFETVDTNNEIVELEERERAEVHRILLQLTDGFRRRATDLEATVEAMVDLDVLLAKGGFSRMVDGVEPVISADSFEIRAARHPLLMADVARRAGAARQVSPDTTQAPVPVDLLMSPPVSAVIVTGPNTGGKTVALKTFGIMALMAQSGLLVPAAEGARIPVFATLGVDIGDEQSIAANLSTFSGHVSHIVDIDAALQLPALVLLDEVGAGTDPSEGGALGQAIVDHFHRRGALVVATTHFDALKSYGATTPGVVCAGFGFDPATFQPTYQLHYGTPGRSLALEIAARLGLPDSILAAARRRRTEREAQLADHLAAMDRQRQAADRDRRLLEAERQRLAELESRVAARERSLDEREEHALAEQRRRLTDRARVARREIDELLADCKQQVDKLREEATRGPRPAISTGALGAVRAAARRGIDLVVDRASTTSLDAASHPGPEAAVRMPTRAPREGDRVAIAGLGREGVVERVRERVADVEVSGKRVRLRVEQLEVLPTQRPRAAAPPVRVTVQLEPRDDQPTELNLVGCRVDEALSRTERFLDDRLLDDSRTVRIIHGYGTGQLRRAIGTLLESHPLVERFHDAEPGRGGGAVTVVELKD